MTFRPHESEVTLMPSFWLLFNFNWFK